MRHPATQRKQLLLHPEQHAIDLTHEEQLFQLKIFFCRLTAEGAGMQSFQGVQ
jgi:hypothetical protein